MQSGDLIRKREPNLNFSWANKDRWKNKSANLLQFKWLESEPLQPLSRRQHLCSCVLYLVQSSMLWCWVSTATWTSWWSCLPFVLTLSTALTWTFDQHYVEPSQHAEETTAFFHIHFLLDLPVEVTQHREGPWYPIVMSGYGSTPACWTSQGNR